MKYMVVERKKGYRYMYCKIHSCMMEEDKEWDKPKGLDPNMVKFDCMFGEEVHSEYAIRRRK